MRPLLARFAAKVKMLQIGNDKWRSASFRPLSVNAAFAISKHLEMTSNDRFLDSGLRELTEISDLHMEQVFQTLEVFSKSGEFTQNEFLEVSCVHMASFSLRGCSSS